MSMRWILFAAAISGASAVIIGAASAHMGNAANMATGYEFIQTGLRYQQWHSIALFALGLFGVFTSPDATQIRRATITAALFVAGILLFSGGLYASVMLDMPELTKITPFGGVCFIAGWLSVALLKTGASR